MISEQYERPREAAKITQNKVSSWEKTNTTTLDTADEKFKEATKKYWREFAASGVLQFDLQGGKQVLQPLTDLGGRATLGVLKEAGIDTNKLTDLKPEKCLEGVIKTYFTPGKSFAVTFKEKVINEEEIKNGLATNFKAKSFAVRRGFTIMIYNNNDKEPLKVSFDEIIDVLG